MAAELPAFIPLRGATDTADSDPVGDAPDWLDDRARSVWERLAPKLRPTAAEADEFACLCVAVGEFQDATVEINSGGGMVLTGPEGEQYANPAVGIRDTADGKIARWTARFRR